MTDLMRPMAWAAYCTFGSPRPYIHAGAVRGKREYVMQKMGKVYARKDETAKQGWRRAYSAGWRIISVRIVPVKL